MLLRCLVYRCHTSNCSLLLLLLQVGVAPNRMLAKICSDVHKPDGQFGLPAEREAILGYMGGLEIR